MLILLLESNYIDFQGESLTAVTSAHFCSQHENWYWTDYLYSTLVTACILHLHPVTGIHKIT